MELTRVNSWANIEALKAEQAEFEKIIQSIVDKIQAVGKVENTLSSASSSKDSLKAMADLEKKTNELAAATADYKKKLDDLVAAQKDGTKAGNDDTKAKGDGTKASRELTLEEAKRGEALKANNKNLRDQAKEALGLIDAYGQLSKQYEQAARAAQNLITTKGKDDEETKAAIANAQKLGQQLKESDALVGKFGRNVGDYANSLAGGFRLVSEEISKLQEKQKALLQQQAANPIGFKQGPIGGNAASGITGEVELNQVTNQIQQLQKFEQIGSVENRTYSETLALMESEFKSLATGGQQSIGFMASLKTQIDLTKKAALEAEGPYGQLVIRFKAATLEAQNLATQYGIQSKQAKEAAKIANELGTQIKEIDKASGKGSDSMTNFGKAVETTKEHLKRFALEALSLIGIFSVASFFKDSIDEFIQLNKTLAILQNTLKNVGAPELFERIESRTKGLIQQFKFLKEADISSVFNKLIVYGKLTENQINQLVPVIVNFATATGQDLSSATSVLLKSLEGNNRGLKEFGINIRDAKTPSEAFSLVMKELAPRVEGVAAAFGESAAGKIAATREEFTRLKEEVGSGLLPVLNALLDVLNKGIKGLKAFYGGLSDAVRGEASFAGSFLLSTLNDNKNVQTEIESQYQQYLLIHRDTVKSLKELQKEGKKTDVTEKDVLDESIKNYTKIRDDANAALKSAAKKGVPNFDEVAGDFAKAQAAQKAITDLQSQRDGNKVIGIGDPDKLFRGGSGKGHDAGADLFKAQDDARKAAFDAQKAFLQASIEASDAILSNDKKNFAERLKAAQEFYDTSLLLIAKTKEFELAEVDAKAEEDKRKAAREIKDTTERTNVIKAIDLKSTQERVKIEADFNKSITTLTNTDEKKRAEIIKKNIDDVEAHRKSTHEEEISDIQSGFEESLADLDQRYARQIVLDKNNKKALVKDEQAYNEEKLRLQTQAQIELLKADIRFAKETLAIQQTIADASGKQEDIDKVTASRQKIHDLDIKLTALAANFKIKSAQNVSKADEDSFKRKMDQLQQVADYAKEVYSIIGSFIDANAEKEKQAAQDAIDALEAKRTKDIAVATQTIVNATEQANAIAVINANADAQKASLEARQKKADEQKAKFEKAANIASIIEETAIAVIRALGDKTVPLPVRIAEAVAIGAIGAAKLAVAIATPLPHYKTGLPEAKESHVGVVGDGGKRELVKYADGSHWISPATPTLTYIPKGAQIFPDIEKMRPAASATIPSNKGFFSWMRSSTTAGDHTRESNKMIERKDSALYDKKSLTNLYNIKEQSVIYQQIGPGLQPVAIPEMSKNDDLIKALQADGQKTRDAIANKQENHFNIVNGQIDVRSKVGRREIIYLNKNLQF